MARAPLTNRIQALREAAGLSQSDLAREIGTSAQNVGRHERGDRRLTIQWIQRYAIALGVTPADLIGSPEVSEAQSEVEPAAIDGMPGLSASLAVKGLQVYRVLASLVPDAGVLPGQIVTVDTSEAATRSIRTGDVALVRLADGEVMLLRQYIAPAMLVTNMPGPRNSVIRLDDTSIGAEIAGVLVRP